MARYSIKIVPLGPDGQLIAPLENVDVVMSVDLEKLNGLVEGKPCLIRPDPDESVVGVIALRMQQACAASLFLMSLANIYQADVFYREEHATMWQQVQFRKGE